MKQSYPILTYSFIALFFIVSGCKNEPITTLTSIDGVRISFDNVGKGEPALILVHGWSNNKSIWDAQVAHFSAEYQVIAVDLPGFGESGNNRSEWTIGAYGEDIANIIQQLKLSNVVLVGFSMGAPVVIEAALKTPDQVIGVVLVDDLQEVEMQIPPTMVNYIDSLMMDYVNNPTKEKLVEGGFFKNNVDSAYHRVLAMIEGASHIGWRESLIGYINWQNESCTNSVHAVKAPIIAINSDLQPTNVEAFRKYAPTFKAKIVQGVGHVVMWDNTDEFNRLLKESIQEFVNEK